MTKNVKRLFKDFKPEHYDLSVQLFPETMTFSGQVKLQGHKVGRPSKRLTFHQEGLKITAAKLSHLDKKHGQKEIVVDRQNSHKSFDELRLHTSSQLFPGKYEIDLEFSGKITKPMDGIYPCFFKDGDQQKIILATQLESHHAREVFPCVDEPEAKATFNLTLESDEGLANISNTDPEHEATKDGRTITRFARTPKMSTYLLAFVSGELKYKEAETASGVRVRAYATADNVSHTTFGLDTAVRCLDFYNEYFGIPYPLDKCDLIALPDFAAGAMENWGCITFREQCLLVDKRHTSLATKQYVAIVVAHELAHQWFGNLVTMRWWTDLWLNEGFASWIEYLACDHLFPDWQLWTQFLIDQREPALRLDALKNTHPIQVPVHHPEEIRTIFDAISYNKGASVINMLHGFLGKDDFRGGLKHYLKTNAYSNTDTIDLWEALEHFSKKPVKRFMHAWTSLPGFPVIQLNRGENGDEIKQSHFLLSNTHEKANHKWPVPLLSSVASDPPLFDGLTHTLPRSTHPRILNQDQTGFYRTAYDEEATNELADLIKERELPLTDRLGLLSDAFESAKAGAISTINALKLLEAYKHEDSAPVWEVIAGSLASVRAVMDSEDLREIMKPYVISLATPQFERLGWDKKPDEPHFDQLLRPTILALLAVCDDPHIVEHAKRLFKDMQTPDDIDAYDREAAATSAVKRGSDIDPDLRGVVYGTVVRHGGEAEFNKLLKMHNSIANSEERSTIAAAMTGFRQPELVQKALDLIVTDTVRLQDALYWVAYSFMNRFAREATWEWLKQNWDWLAKNFSGDLGFYRVPVYAARAFSDDKFLERYKDFFEPKRSPAFDRSIDQGEEIIGWHSAWKRRDFESIMKYFQES